MSGIWERFLQLIGAGPSEEEKLDQAAGVMQKVVGAKRDVAARIVAQARTLRRDLGAKVSRYQELQAAAVTLQREGKTDAVDYIATQMASLSSEIQTLTQEVQDLNAQATEAVADYRQENTEVSGLLQQHGRHKAIAQMNRAMEALREEVRALGTGTLTARGTYEAVARQIGTTAQEFRALAELETGDATRRAEVTRALEDVKVAGILGEIRTLALGSGETVIDAQIVEQANAALDADPIRGALPAPTIEVKDITGAAEGETGIKLEGE